MVMAVGQHADNRRALKPLRFDIPPLLREHGMTRGSQRRRMRHLATGYKGVAGIGGQTERV